jgi:hypothetical protein
MSGLALKRCLSKNLCKNANIARVKGCGDVGMAVVNQEHKTPPQPD